MHELEELLFDDSPLRPHKKTSAQSGKMKELIDMDSKFLPYDYTKYHSTSATIPSPSSSNLIRRVGSALNDKMDQTKYTSQGYIELSTAANITTTTTTTTTTVLSACKNKKSTAWALRLLHFIYFFSPFLSNPHVYIIKAAAEE